MMAWKGRWVFGIDTPNTSISFPLPPSPTPRYITRIGFDVIFNSMHYDGSKVQVAYKLIMTRWAPVTKLKKKKKKTRIPGGEIFLHKGLLKPWEQIRISCLTSRQERKSSSGVQPLRRVDALQRSSETLQNGLRRGQTLTTRQQGRIYTRLH